MAKSRRLQEAVRFALATAAAAGVSSLHAQEAPAPAAAPAAPIEEVIVTGSRLATPGETSISPITTVSAVDIQQTGLTRVEDVLNTMPQVYAAMNSTTSNGATGVATVSLRGLGPNRTLVLVDGLRLGPGTGLTGSNAADINQIPSELIERVDILTGGASAVYGADAVAGVVNFILNTHFEGVKVDGGYHFEQHNNDNQAGVAQLVTAAGDALPPSEVNTAFGKFGSLVAGSNFADNKGNATAYITYDNQGPALQSSYDYSACTLGINGTFGPKGVVAPYSLSCLGSGTTAKNGAGGNFYAFSKSGAPIPGIGSSYTVDGKTGVFRPLTSSDLFNFGPYNYYQTPNERWTAGSFVNYDINSHVTFYTQIMAMRNTSAAQIAPSGDFNQGHANFIACANPLLTAQEESVICNPANLALQGNPTETYNGVSYPGLIMDIERRNVEGLPRIAAFTNNSEREVAGIKGDFGAFDPKNAWTYNVYASHDSTDAVQSNEGYLIYPLMQEALNVLPGPGGKAVCGTGAPSLTNPHGGFSLDPACVPWNVWAPNGVTQAAENFMTSPLLQNSGTTQYVADASVTGDFGKYGVQLPWADSGLQANFGTEYRQEQSYTLPDYESQQGNGAGGGGSTPPISGQFHVSEVFTEMRLPIAEHQFLAEDLQINGAYRYSKYTEGFKTDTFALGLEWAPVHDIRFRGGYQRAVRAPNISELFSPDAVGLDGSIDPCSVKAIGQTPSASLAACERSGVLPRQYGKIIADPANQYNGLLGGNTSLTPETADTYTLGLIFTPTFLPNFTFGVDYYNIQIKNTIGALGGNTILLDCLSTGQFCSDVHRDVDGSLWLSPQGYVTDTTTNAGAVKTAGIDFNSTYRLAAGPFGSVLFNGQVTYLKEYSIAPVAGAEGYSCVGYFGNDCGGGNPQFRGVLNITWSTPWDGLDLNVRWRYFGHDISESTNSSPYLSATSYYPPLAHIPAYSWFDLSATFNIYKNVRLELGANNVLDKTPPIVPLDADCSTGPAVGSPGSFGANCNGNTFPGVYDAMGRYLFMHLTAQF
jgi:iron complex outermembrane receptor protein